MKRFLEKIVHTIIPQKKNGNIPYILKAEFVLALLVFVGVLFYFNQNNLNIVKRLNLTATVYPAVLADLTNHDRATSGVNKLTWNTTLEKAAKMKAEDMLKNSYFAHTSPTGVTPWHWFKEVNYNFIYAGENLAVDFNESQNVENAWLNSPKHKENIINSNFTEIGIATAEGFFDGKNTTFVVELFGSPSKIQTEEKPIVKANIIKKIDNVVVPTVAGASTNSFKEEGIKVVSESDKVIVVKNESSFGEVVPTSNNLTNKPISTWYQRFIIEPTSTIEFIYKIILGFVLLSTLLLLAKKYQKHHTKHIVMGIVLTILIAILLVVISVK